MSSQKLLVACLAALTQKATAQRYDAPWYNGQIEYFIADLAPGYPCHPQYEASKTWFEADTEIGVRNLLTGLAPDWYHWYHWYHWYRCGVSFMLIWYQTGARQACLSMVLPPVWVPAQRLPHVEEGAALDVGLELVLTWVIGLAHAI